MFVIAAAGHRLTCEVDPPRKVQLVGRDANGVYKSPRSPPKTTDMKKLKEMPAVTFASYL